LKKEQLGAVSLKVRLGGALCDSVGIACRERMGPRDWNKPTRGALIVISDGDDNASHITQEQVASEEENTSVSNKVASAIVISFYMKMTIS
jgi:hypothetical protein